MSENQSATEHRLLDCPDCDHRGMVPGPEVQGEPTYRRCERCGGSGLVERTVLEQADQPPAA
jgi:DNA-directed RNA polymerase subunit RPC12/RpoP